MCAMGVVGTLGQWFLIRAFTVAEAGAIAPYSYVGLVFALIIGLVFWGEWPDAMTLFGASIIIGAGVYVWYRERRLSEAPIVND
jgi:drug/metabolite transporter (DMT)-like permease